MLTSKLQTEILCSTEKIGFNCYAVELKGETEYFVEGYVSTYDKDKVNDVVSKTGMLDIHRSCDVLKADLEHEAFKPDTKGYGSFGSRDALIPVAKIVEKRLDNVGVWVKAKLNPHINGFKSLWGSIKDGFVDAFSITFSEPSVSDYELQSDGTRILNKINLLNVALTGNPINETARFTNVIAKSMEQNFKKEGIIMDEEKVEAPVETVKTEEVAKPVEKVDEVVEDVEKPSTELKAIVERLESIESRLTVPKAEVKADVKVDYKAVMDKLDVIEKRLDTPVLKGEIISEKEVKPEDISMYGFIK